MVSARSSGPISEEVDGTYPPLLRERNRCTTAIRNAGAFGHRRRPLRRAVEGGLMSQPHRTPPGSSPAVESSPKRSGPALSRETSARLDRHIEWAMLRRTDWQDHLRVTVRVATAEMRLAGLTNAEVVEAIRAAVENHPTRSTYDAESLLTRELRSTQLTTLMLRWVNGLRAPRR